MTRKAKRGPDLSAPETPSRETRGQSALALVVFALPVGSFLLPFVLWGNPYPPGLLSYWAVGGGIAVIVAAGLAAAPWPWLDTIPGRLGAVLRALPPFGWIAALGFLVAGLGVLAAAYAFSRAPSTPDEISQLWHARVLLSGHVALPVDPNPEFFALETIVDIDRWYSHFPIGGPLALVLGAMFDRPWLVNPVLAALACIATYLFARRVFDETQARAAALLLGLSPMALMMSGTWMNHVPTMLLATGALLALSHWDDAGRGARRSAFAAGIGLALGGMATIRPLDAIAVAVAIGGFQCARIVRDHGRFASLLVQVGAGIVGVAPLLIANAATTGSPWRFGYEVIWGPEHGLGFHVDPYGELHTLHAGIENAIAYLGELNIYLLAWPLPVVVLLGLGYLAVRRVSAWDALLLGLIGAQAAAYVVYWGEGSFLGPRFLFTALPALLLVLTRSGFLVAERFPHRGPRFALFLALSCAIVAWSAKPSPYSVPGLTRQVRDARQSLKVDLAAAARDAGVDRGVIFVREPMSRRLARRLWAVGFLRRDAVRILARADACSIVESLRAVEATGATGRAAMEAMLAGLSVFREGPGMVRTTDPEVRISSPEGITPACRAEIDLDAEGVAAYGPAFLLNAFDDLGRVSGDLIWVADLGERNAVLRGRFADRPWYSLAVNRESGGTEVKRMPD